MIGPSRGPSLPSALHFALLLIVARFSSVQYPIAAAVGGPPEQLLAGLRDAYLWGEIQLLGFTVGFLGLPLLGALQRRGFDLAEAGWRGWLAFYGVFAATGLAGAALRIDLATRFTPALMAGKDPLGMIVMSAALVVVYAGLAEALNAMLRRHDRHLDDRRGLAEQLADSRAAMVATDDDQRRELAELLHGKFQTYLVVIDAQLAAAADAPPAEQAELLAQARAALADLRGEAVGRMHERLGDDRADLPAALDALVVRFQQVRPLAQLVEPGAIAAARAVPPRLARLAGDLVAEAMLNAHRHAGPDAVLWVHLGFAPDGRLQLAVRDDGVGFDPARGGRGLGLGGLASGLAELGAAWTVDSAPGRGTTVTLRLPGAPAS